MYLMRWDAEFLIKIQKKQFEGIAVRADSVHTVIPDERQVLSQVSGEMVRKIRRFTHQSHLRRRYLAGNTLLSSGVYPGTYRL